MLMREVGSPEGVRARPARVRDRRGRQPPAGDQNAQVA